MHALYLVSVVLHLLAVATWIGAMVILVAVVVPLVRREEWREVGPRLLREAGLRLRPVTWTALVVLVATGVFQVLHRVGPAALADPAFWAGSWGHLLAVKLLVVALILALAGWHDFRVGPRASELAATDAEAPAALRLRRRAAWIGRTNLVLSLTALVLGVLLVRGA